MLRTIEVLLGLAAVGGGVAFATWLLLRRRLKNGRVASRPSRALRACFLGLAATAFALLAYGRFIEPRWVEITHVYVRTDKFPPGAPSVRVVLISDLHCEARPGLEARIPGLVAKQKPDAIVFTGDAINSREALPVFQRCMNDLAAIAPTFAIYGNWDTWFFKDMDRYAGTRVRLLDIEAVPFQAGPARVWIVGLPAGAEMKFNRALDRVPEGAFVLFAHHYPDLVYEAAERGVDLYVAGHTHGGQVALPFYGALITFSKFGKRFESGAYRVGDTLLYVTRGIGMEGNAPRVRLFAWPEVTVIDIKPAR